MREFPPFRLDTANECLWRRERAEDQRILLTPKAYAVLVYLIDRAGRLVTQHELLEAIWPDTFVQPEVLKYQIADIRSALGDSARKPSFIETLPRRGYRFVAAVREEESNLAALAVPPAGRLVGRQRELTSLHQSLRRASGGERQLVFITGEPGIGKTALVEEFVRQASAAEPFLRIARGHTVEGTGVSEAFYPVLDAVGQLCRGPDGTELIELLAQRAPTWLVQFPGLVKPEDREKLRPELLGATRDRMLREIRDALDAFAARKPVLYIYEDPHWLDPSTLDLLSAFAHDRTQAKVMVIITMRSPAGGADDSLSRIRQELLVHRFCLEIPLAPLSESDVAAWLACGSPASGLPEGFAGLVYRRSEGNPLVMVATLDRMLQKGDVTKEHGQWKLAVPAEQIDLEVPETLRQLIEAQIDRLTLEDQRALEAASLVGTSFSANAVAGVTGIDADRLLECFERLARRTRFIRTGPSRQLHDGSIVQIFAFVHMLYRDVFYWRQTPARRASLQLRIGPGQR